MNYQVHRSYLKHRKEYVSGLRTHLSYLVCSGDTYKHMVSKVLRSACPFENLEHSCNNCKEQGQCMVCWTTMRSYGRNGWIYAYHDPDPLLVCDTIRELTNWYQRESNKVFRRLSK